jgi:hypothetical protein
MVGGKPGKQAGFDVVLHIGSFMALVEVKCKAHLNDIEPVPRYSISKSSVKFVGFARRTSVLSSLRLRVHVHVRVHVHE